MWEEVELLEDHPNLEPHLPNGLGILFRRPCSVDGLECDIIHVDLALLNGLEPVDTPEECAFSAPDGPMTPSCFAMASMMSSSKPISFDGSLGSGNTYGAPPPESEPQRSTPRAFMVSSVDRPTAMEDDGMKRIRANASNAKSRQ